MMILSLSLHLDKVWSTWSWTLGRPDEESEPEEDEELAEEEDEILADDVDLSAEHDFSEPDSQQQTVTTHRPGFTV